MARHMKSCNVVIIMTAFTYDSRPHQVGASVPTAKAENDNFPVAAHWQTPAETVQTIRRWRQEMRQELRADFSLRACPEHRKRWELMHAMEKCALWLYFRVTSD